MLKRVLAIVALISAAAACGGGTGVTTPVATATATPLPSRNANSSPTPNPTLSPVPQTQSSFALVLSQFNFSTCSADQGQSIFIYAAGSAALSQRITAPCALGQPAYDQNGALWGVAAYGINPDGTSAGTFAPPGTLLAFDLSGKVYVEDPSTIALDVYPSSSSTTMIRQIILPKAAVQASVDSTGNTYVATTAGVYEYAPTASGNAAPVASNLGAEGAVATDGSGNVYAFYTSNATIGIWQAGTFGSNAPQRLIVPPLAPFSQTQAFGFGVDHVGDIYVLGGGAFDEGGPVYYVPAGSSSVAQLPASDIQQYIAVPLH